MSSNNLNYATVLLMSDIATYIHFDGHSYGSKEFYKDLAVLISLYEQDKMLLLNKIVNFLDGHTVYSNEVKAGICWPIIKKYLELLNNKEQL